MSPDRNVVVVCANPGITLKDAAGAVTAYASAWRVDWSPYGRGNALVAWHDGRVDVYGENLDLAGRLEREFVRHFPEVDGLPWPAPEVRRTPVKIALDLADGCTASAGDLTIEWGDGRPLPGEVALSGTSERPGSTAFVTDAEVWLR